MKFPEVMFPPFRTAMALGVIGMSPGLSSEDAPPKGYPDGVRAIHYPCPADGSEQPALFWAPEIESGKSAPLLVAMHTWSGDYRQAGGEASYARWCQQQGWIFLHPNFRGPNRTKEAMGSDLVIEDVKAAIDWARKEASVDESRIYAIGVSGGGHATQLLAGRLPDTWAAISSWCGISDIAAWHRETRAAQRARYAQDIEGALGGTPLGSDSRAADAWHRSPLKWLEHAGEVPLDLNHGIDDGRTGSVPFTHSLHAWNAVVPKSHRIPDEVIAAFYETRSPPPEGGLPGAEKDLLYGKKVPLFRRRHGNTRVTIFRGGHEIVHEAALNWLAAQRKGQPVNWDPPRTGSLQVSKTDQQSGK